MTAISFEERVQSEIGYKLYVALIDQAGTNPPSEQTVLINTFTGAITWSRSSAGVYVLNSAGSEFTLGKTAVFFRSTYTGTTPGFLIARPSSMSASAYEFETWDSALSVNTDGVLDPSEGCCVEVRVYP